MDCRELVFTGHATLRMFQRRVTPADIRSVLEIAQIVEDYPSDKPFPSRLVLGSSRGQVLHVVVAVDAATGKCHIVTVYGPDPVIWMDDFKRRKPK